MAINLQSPGIKISERDQIASVGSVGTTTGASVGEFGWGPIDEPTLVTSESDLVKKFGAPTTSNNVDFLSAAAFMAYSASQYVTRVAEGTAVNATAGGTGILVKNDDAYEGTTFVAGTHGTWVARHAGVLGNSIKVVMAANSTAYLDASFDSYRDFFDVAPGTSDYATALGGADDELHIAVIDEDGEITGVPGSLLEKFELVSKASDARGIDSGSNYYVTVINNESQYIRWSAHPETTTIPVNWGTAANGTTFTDGDDGSVAYVDSLSGGLDGTGVTSSERIAGIDLLANKFTFDVDVIICGQGDATVANKAIAIAEARKDCVAVFSPLKSDVVANAGSESTDIATWADTVTRSTYGIADSNWKYAYDKYNDVYVWVPVNADVAGCIARVDANLDPWFSPAGYDNGRILNSVRLAWNPAETERDALYKISVNPVFSQPGRGTVLFGDKTFTQKKTTFSRINVRRLFITMQSVIGDSAGDVLFDQNDAATRSGFVNIVEAYLRSVQGGRGIQDFRVICDETNNPDEIVSANGFVCDIFVQPTFSVNFIQLNFTSVAGAAAFAEIGG